jgi:pimeloyl-ACP methyl ester carboxylesterase
MAHPVATLVISFLVLSGNWFRQREDDSPPAAAKDNGAVQLETKTGTLHGTIDIPAGNGPFPIVILLPGSGPTDRDGNQTQMKNDCLKQLGQGLAGKGIAVLRYDRRGVGKSSAAAPKEEDYRFEMLIEDVVAWVEFLKKDARFTGIGIAGHSEGALVGMLAAKRAPVAAYVSLAGAGRRLTDVLREQLGKNLPESQKAKWEPIVNELEAGRTVDDVPKDLLVLFRPSVQPYLISLFKLDPARELAEVKVPVLIVQGTTDLQVTTADSKRLSEAKKDAKLFVVENMNHLFKRATTNAEQQAAYFNPNVPVMPEIIDEVASFLNKALAKPR